MKYATLNDLGDRAVEIAEDHGWLDRFCCHQDKDSGLRPFGITVEKDTHYEADYSFSVDDALAQLMLVTTEVAEAAECVRNAQFEEEYVNGKPEGLPSELADIVIRTAQIARVWGIDLDGAVSAKMKFNQGREFMHGGKLA